MSAYSSKLRRVQVRPREPWPYFVTFWLLAAVLFGIIGFGGVYARIWGTASLAIFSLFIVVIWRQTWSGRPWTFHGILLPVLAFGLLVMAQYEWRLSVYPGLTLSGMLPLAACGALLYCALYAAGWKNNLFLIARVLWIFTGLLSLEAIYQFFSAHGYIYWFHNATYATPIGPYVYHNFYAGCMDLLLPIAIVYSFQDRASPDPIWLTRIRRGLIPALALASLALSYSRGGILTLLVEVILAGVVLAPHIRKRSETRHLILLSLLFFSSFLFLGNFRLVIERFAHLSRPTSDIRGRFILAETCWKMFLHRPWLGFGFNTFSVVYPAFETVDNGLFYLYAHNDYAQTLTETGLAGAFCVLCFLGIWASAFWRAAQAVSSGAEIQALRLAMFIGCTGFLFHAYGDFMFHAPANAMLFYLLCGFALGSLRQTVHDSGVQRDIRKSRILSRQHF